MMLIFWGGGSLGYLGNVHGFQPAVYFSPTNVAADSRKMDTFYGVTT